MTSQPDRSTPPPSPTPSTPATAPEIPPVPQPNPPREVPIEAGVASVDREISRLLPTMPEALALAIGSILAYGTAWLYRAGQIGAMGVPVDFAEFTINTGTLFAVLIFALSVAAALILQRFTAAPKGGEWILVAVVALIVGTGVLTLFGQAYTFQLAGLVTIACLSLFFAGSRYQVHVVCIATLILTVGASYFIGQFQTRTATNHSLVRMRSDEGTGPEWLLATVFDGKLVCVPFHVPTRTAGPGFILMEPTEDVIIEFARTGPVRYVGRPLPPRVETAEVK